MEASRTDLPVVLVIDEVPPVVRLIELELGFQGLRTENVLLSDDPVKRAESLEPDVIVLGAVIPTPELFDILLRLKQKVLAPVIFVNGTANQADEALALEMGADDVISRPFSPEDLGLRLRNLLDHELPEAAQIKRGPLTIDHLRRQVWNRDRKLSLGTNEWTLLLALAQSEAVLSAEEFLISVWGEKYAGEVHFLKTWITRLRINLGDDPNSPQLVLGDADIGYWLAD